MSPEFVLENKLQSYSKSDLGKHPVFRLAYMILESYSYVSKNPQRLPLRVVELELAKSSSKRKFLKKEYNRRTVGYEYALQLGDRFISIGLQFNDRPEIIKVNDVYVFDEKKDIYDKNRLREFEFKRVLFNVEEDNLRIWRHIIDTYELAKTLKNQPTDEINHLLLDKFENIIDFTRFYLTQTENDNDNGFVEISNEYFVESVLTHLSRHKDSHIWNSLVGLLLTPMSLEYCSVILSKEIEEFDLKVHTSLVYSSVNDHGIGYKEITDLVRETQYLYNKISNMDCLIDRAKNTKGDNLLNKLGTNFNSSLGYKYKKHLLDDVWNRILKKEVGKLIRLHKNKSKRLI